MSLLSRYGRSAYSRKLRGPSALLRLAFLSTASPASPGAPSPARPGGPPPIRVALTESAGRGVFASRRIGSGELIHTAEPVVSHPSLHSLHAVCYFCLRKLDGAGSPARAASFCSDGCRARSKAFYEVETRVDWSIHDDYCRARGLKYPFLVKRLACMVISGATSSDCLDILQPAYLSPEMISEMEEGFGLLKCAFTNAHLKDEQIAFLTKQWYTTLLARIHINAFRVEVVGGSFEDLLSMAVASVEAEAAVGNAVYMLPSFYNHDCDPNTHIIWLEDAVAKLKALRDIEPGEELRICYIDASLDWDARQSLLSQGFGFRCDCPRCLSGD
ncbi:histone-lysine N-methyltransferase ATXR4 isoform X1 [Eucalyptus grandis]|uniref:histone-lysine N-methyltransferase ATXR4 isoform X1 n=1 Tax=Eucalyptus grandis TaxID=71139 RepID=UPI00192EF23B|nr:histone-lysine N-methyltransferase ATXR4 isoform X1 [Eucalyptus grandis]